jgi:hypothetical protein
LTDLKQVAQSRGIEYPVDITARALCDLINSSSTASAAAPKPALPLPPPPAIGIKKAAPKPAKKWGAVEVPKAYPDWYYKGAERENNAQLISTLPITNLLVLEKLAQNYDPSRVWIAFDYDATLTEKDEHGEMQLRGGETSRQVLQRLRDKGAHFLLLTAAVKSGTPNAFQVITDEMRHLGIETFFEHKNSPVKKADEQEWFIKGPLTSAALFTKGGLFRHYLSFEQKFGDPQSTGAKPQLLVFVDDSGNNVLNLLAELRRMPFDVDVVAAHYQPAPGKTSGVGVDATSKETALQIFDLIDPKLKPLADYGNYPLEWRPKSGPTLKLYRLGKSDSMEPINEWMQQQVNADPSNILVGFDIDGTLTDLSSKMPAKTLRGGEKTRAFIESLNTRGIKWFAMSGRMGSVPASERIAGALFSPNLLNLPSPQWSKQPVDCAVFDKFASFKGTVLSSKPQPKKKDAQQQPTFMFDGKEYNTYQCNNAIGVALGDDDLALTKEATIEYAVSQYFPQYPKLIVFVDDNAHNLVNIYNHFTSGSGKAQDVTVLLVLYEPHQPEETHAQGYETLLKLGLS